MDHTKLVERRAEQDANAPEGLKISQMALEDRQLPLEQKKRKITRNLRTLEQAGLVHNSNKYQDIINEISKVSERYWRCPQMIASGKHRDCLEYFKQHSETIPVLLRHALNIYKKFKQHSSMAPLPLHTLNMTEKQTINAYCGRYFILYSVCN